MPPEQSPQERRKGYGISLVVALLIIIGLGSWFAYYISNTQPLVDTTLREQFVWVVTPAAPLSATSGPRLNVALKIADAVLPVGVYPGSCDVIDGTHLTLLANELSGVICRYNNGGTEIGIFRGSSGALTIQQGTITSGVGRGTDFKQVVQEATSTK